ncbi:MAG: dihydropteroate synthase [Kiritimatiellae bacterium]|nr:dihydropteroate synthase [Kiritimatiellia bacterium]
MLEWKCRDQTIKISDRPLIMGILNITPDSFSDGGNYIDHNEAIKRAHTMLQEGADIIDIGGESTRPGAATVSAEEEIKRVIPVIKELSKSTDAIISTDTTKADVAEAAIDAGAHIINDISALTYDPRMITVAKESSAGVVLMHMLGTPQTMQNSPEYKDVAEEVNDFFSKRIQEITAAGIKLSSLAIDPGIGFGKTIEHNISLIKNIETLTQINIPVIVGLSRKSFLGKLTGKDVSDRLASSLAGLVISVINGANIIRVHDVDASRDAILTAMALK